MNSNGSAFPAAGKRKWELSKFSNNNRTQIAREKRRKWNCKYHSSKKENQKKRKSHSVCIQCGFDSC